MIPVKNHRRQINVLVFPAGSEIGMEIYKSLKYNPHITLFGATGTKDHAEYLYDKNHYALDDLYINKPEFIDRFNALLLKWKIEVIFPTHDAISLFLAQHTNKIKAKVITTSYETALIAREKEKTYELFKSADFCPAFYSPPFENVSFPVFLKPNIGEGSRGTFLVKNKEELIARTNENPGLVACEYLPGDELSVDCFSNFKGELLFAGPRSRERVTIGISFHSASVPLTEEIKKIAASLNSALKLRGGWFFQIKKDKNGKFKLLEFAVRQASTMGLYRQVGVNFAILSVFDALNMDVKILQNNYSIELDRCLQNRYKLGFDFDRVWIDFDDTIIINNQVNDVAMQFIYQMVNKGKEIILLTRHQEDLKATLKHFRISEIVFDQIVHIDFDHKKVDYIDRSEKSIFIDNAFEERNSVFQKFGMPVFDVDAIESLID